MDGVSRALEAGRRGQPLLAEQRRALILSQLAQSGAVRMADLVEQLGVSDMTMRRDIERLAREGLARRVRGGALAVPRARRPGPPPGPATAAHERESVPSAVELAHAAAGLVEPGSSIGISAGTTTYELARAVRGVPDLTVVTNSMSVAQVLHEAGTAGQTVVLTGGVRTPSDALVGPVAVAALRMVHVDRLFLGVHGIDVRAGLTTPSLVEAETSRAMIHSARRLCVLADGSAWGRVSFSTIAPLSVVDELVLDDELATAAGHVLSEQVGSMLVAPTALAAPAVRRCRA